MPLWKNCFEVFWESGEDGCRKSASTPVELLKQRPNEDLRIEWRLPAILKTRKTSV